MKHFFDKRVGKVRVTIEPGEMYATRADELIYTVLGSCIAVCLHDEAHGIGGMNHFMLSKPAGGGKIGFEQMGRYGEAAMTLLLMRVTERGADRDRLTAKVFGGAVMTSACCIQNCVSKENRQFATAFLKTAGIPVVSSDTGGNAARRIHFDISTGRVTVELVSRAGLDSCRTLIFDSKISDFADGCCHDGRVITRNR